MRRDLRDAEIVATQQVARDGHAPREEILASLAFELAPFNVRVKLVEPGYGPTTRFTSNGRARMDGLLPEPYAAFAERVFASMGQATAFTAEFDVAQAIGRAATDTTDQLRFPAGPDAVALARSGTLT